MSYGTIVLGMHRSGTSLVAEMLHRAGLFGREEECLPANQWNEHGYWELSGLVELNERLLHEVDSDWTLPPGPRQARRLSEMAQTPHYRREAVDLLHSMRSAAGTNRPWFWKDPRLSMVLPFWQKIWGDVRYVICVRNPLDVSDSLARRDGFSSRVSLRLWESYAAAILNQTLKRPRLFVQYGRVLKDPARECLRLAGFLDFGTSLHAAIPAMQHAVDKKLRHSTALSGSRFAVTLDATQAALYRTLQCMASSSPAEQPASGEYRLPRFWRASLQKDLLWMRCRKRCNRILDQFRGTGAAERDSVGCLKGTASSAYEIYG